VAFEHAATQMSGVVVMTRSRLDDHRGFLSRLFDVDEFAAAGMTRPIVQINQTLTRQPGTIRGMHFQYPPHAEMKVVTVIRGEIFDVALDLRRHSPTYLQWHGEVLSAENRRALLVPEGVAHGFQSLAADTEILYFHTAVYVPAAEGGVHALDPRLAIRWPLPIADISDRDRAHPTIDGRFEGILV
jgi:dTDP-4-dehydrorhamnose 3,5-epimerase